MVPGFRTQEYHVAHEVPPVAPPSGWCYRWSQRLSRGNCRSLSDGTAFMARKSVRNCHPYIYIYMHVTVCSEILQDSKKLPRIRRSMSRFHHVPSMSSRKAIHTEQLNFGCWSCGISTILHPRFRFGASFGDCLAQKDHLPQILPNWMLSLGDQCGQSRLQHSGFGYHPEAIPFFTEKEILLP